MIRRILSACAAAAVVVTALAAAGPAAAYEFDYNEGGTPLVLHEKSRLQGDDRYATAVAASRATYPGTADTVYLASGLNFPDALSAGPIAARAKAPLLLTTPWGLPLPVRAELERLKPKRIVLVGGTSSISAAVERTVVPLASSVVREGGANRYTTSWGLADRAFPGTVPAVYLATAADYPDALSAGAAAARDGAPVLLVDGQAPTLHSTVVALIKRMKPTTIYAVGGAAVIPDKLLASVRPVATVTRLGGTDRYATAAAVGATWTSATRAYIASGQNFPDALVGSSVAGSQGQPLFIVPDICMPPEVTKTAQALKLTDAIFLGGPAAVAEETSLQSCDARTIIGPMMP
ncbi:cell wall-binding repeat-containing protein [Leifsonia sp. F6_8S_P_1B]|uniref:Cell wall-binding repeat-containing protein n=1 Tax=Leifsonia williamsii TaxID=3035919 RepID=A0ABT8KGR6_9MICO|nr:cell wall-binding repeat-containing protein [Leifsonia williamsii]MDN4615961.1 cell wall-binding repeat-containing protein [Leifsonia williamsii]